jgi:hypothetical protein
MREKPPSPRTFLGTDLVALALPRHSSLRSLAERRGMRGLSSSHLGALRFICFEGNYPVGVHDRTRWV